MWVDLPLTIIFVYPFGRQRHHGPVIALVECPNIQLLKSGLRVLEDFPCVTIPANLRDNQYQVILTH